MRRPRQRRSDSILYHDRRHTGAGRGCRIFRREDSKTDAEHGDGDGDLCGAYGGLARDGQSSWVWVQDRIGWNLLKSCPFSMHGLRIAQKAPESKIVTQNEPEFLMQSFSEFDGKRCALKAEKMTDNSKILKKVEVLSTEVKRCLDK